MTILGVHFFAFNASNNQYARCFVLIQEVMFSATELNKITTSKNYLICSEFTINKLIRSSCENEGGEVWKAYLNAESNGYSFTDFPDNGSLNMSLFKFPKFGEPDFEILIGNLGGRKIPETDSRTPDFEIKNVLLELKDLQKEGLENRDKRKSIARIFEDCDDYVVNLDPSLDLGESTWKYHKSIKNTIQNHVKSASDQIKKYSKSGDHKSAGIVILNTGFFSLPHDLLKDFVSHILKHNTKTVEFAFLLTQKMQTNGLDMYATFQTDWIGNRPEELKGLKDLLDEYINKKMTEMMTINESVDTLKSQKPISFEVDNKVFYWNPGQLRFPWEKK